MALTVTLYNDGGPATTGHVNEVRGTLAFDSSYPTGGEALTAAALGLGQIVHLEVFPHEGCSFAVETTLPATSVNVKAYLPGATFGAAGTASTDDAPLSGTGATTTVSFGQAGAAGSTIHFGLMKEAADTEDLSSLAAVPFRALGY